MSRKPGKMLPVWYQDACDECGNEYYLTRTVPRKRSPRELCSDCESYERGYNDGEAHGFALSFASNRPEVEDCPGDLIEKQLLHEVFEERMRQETKWGQQDHEDGYWSLVLGEEVGEACQASLQGRQRDLRAELVQVAAVAVAWIGALDRRNKIAE